ncbi:MAG: hypothetical protein Q9163_003500 [Psora crenata]
MREQQNIIHVVNGYEKDAYTYYPILVVGAGVSGIALGCQLKEVLGFDQFRIFDRQSGAGGTWWINRYPGVAPEWTTLHPPGPEIIRYMQDVCKKYQITDKIQCNTDITELRWLEEEQEWQATLLHMVPGTGDMSGKDRQTLIAEKGREAVYIKEEIVRAKIICNCTGCFIEPNSWPDDIPGREQFEGDIFHSARWKHDVDLQNKDVIVVGTGCSAAQLVPNLIKEPHNAKSVTQIMRSPPWVEPKHTPPVLGELWEKYSRWCFTYIPGLSRAFRLFTFLAAEKDFWDLFLQTPRSIQGRKKHEVDNLQSLREAVPEQYHEILTPDYEVGCKRRIYEASWFPSLNDPKIDLTTKPLTSIQPRGVTLGPGRTYPPMEKTDSKVSTEEVHLPADAIILAHGFEVSTWLAPIRIIGKGGAIMQEVWNERGGPQAYLGLAMDGFPNMFIIIGPNTITGHSSVILASENMVGYTLKFIRKILNGDVKTVDIKKEKEIAWTNEIQDRLKDTVYSQADFTLRSMFPKWGDWDIQYTRKGLIKQRIQQILQVLAFAACLFGALAIRKDPVGGLAAIPAVLKRAFKIGPFVPPAWETKDDRVRGGASASHLTPLSSNGARFHGHLDTSTLGGAGFASQFSAVDAAPLSTPAKDDLTEPAGGELNEQDRFWDLSGYNGLEIELGDGNDDGKTYTLILKDEPGRGKREEDGREKAGLNWEVEFTASTHVEHPVWIPWKEFKATYRGKEVDNVGDLKTTRIRRLGIMMRSYFGRQDGDFSLEVRSISARKSA